MTIRSPMHSFGLAAVCASLMLYAAGPDARTFEVRVSSNRFDPANLEVQAGDSVRWVFTGGIHTATSGSDCSTDGRWDSGEQGPGGSFTHTATFAEAGTYPYFCRPHCALGMSGRIVVMAASPSPTPSPDSCQAATNPIPAGIGRGDVAEVALNEVASGQGLVSPNWGIAAPGDKRHLFVTDTVGKLWAINIADGSKNLVLDVSSLLVGDLGFPFPSAGGYDERGLLGVAFHPKFQRNGLVYLLTTEPYDTSVLADFTLSGLQPGNTPDNRIVISEWRVDNPRAMQPVVSGSRRVVMTVDHPQFNHNGGALNFGRDGFLYIALGDGGGANDQDAIGGHNAGIGNGQDRSTVLGKILRINPRKRTSLNGQYGIPHSNPYFAPGSRGGAAGCGDGLCDEIWAYGFRNPYRFSFDKSNGNLLAGDAGQNDIEEVDWVRKGRNYGWRYKEGSLFFNPNSGNGAAFVTSGNCLGAPDAGLTDPITQYDHDEGVAIVGGFVYRGKAITGLRGQYLFGDYAGAGSTGGRLFRIRGGGLAESVSPLRTITELRIRDDAPLGMRIFGFGQDAKGELYVMGNTSGVPVPRDESGAYRETGVIKKLLSP